MRAGTRKAAPASTPRPEPQDAAPREVAVVDVGSNSVRLVLYRVDGRAIWTTYNEKVLCGLGRDLGRTGRLSPEGVGQALGALRRFQAVIGPSADADGGREVLTAATAAVRDADDGDAFAARVEAETGLRLRVLSGEEEARFSALGVAAGQAGADGVVGDLGGSSLELVRLDGARPGPGVTLPLGPLALGAGVKGATFNPAKLRAEIGARLDAVAAGHRSDVFYAVGGAWRNLALLKMAADGYPLRIVHQYEMRADEALDAARLVMRQSRPSLERVDGVSKKRAEILPYAALVLEGLVERLGVRRVAISAYGLREGLIFDRMSAGLRACDPLVEGCASLGARMGLAGDLGPALERWLRPLWREVKPVFGRARGDVLLAAAARLCDVGAALHPDHRAQLVFDQVLRAPLAGLNHAERAYLAQAAFSRHTSSPSPPEGALLSRVAPPEALAEARTLGAALRLGADLCGRNAALLDGVALTFAKGQLALSARSRGADLLLGEQTRKRLAVLAEALGADAKLVSG